MGKWFQEEVAGDRYIFDSNDNPVVLGCPQGAPVFVIIGENERVAQRACDAHNAEIEAYEAKTKQISSDFIKAMAFAETLERRIKELEVSHG